MLSEDEVSNAWVASVSAFASGKPPLVNFLAEAGRIKEFVACVLPLG